VASSAAPVSSSASSPVSSGSPAGSPISASNATVNVGVLPIADVAPLYLGIKQGFFAQQQLTVKTHVLQGGAAVASAVVGGSLDFGFGATANVVQAKASGLPLQFVANGDQAGLTAATAWSGILVAKGSAVTSIKQLAGKTVAANAAKGENELALDSVLEANGVNPTSVHIVALGFPNMPSALTAGQVAAVTEVEPFVSAIKASGGTELSPLFEGMDPGMTVAGYFATTKEISNNADVVKRFVTAMNESLDYAAANPAAVRAIIPTYTTIPAAAASKLALPTWGSTIQTASIQTQENLMQKLGWITKTIPAAQLVWSGAKTS
jgi:NitT/TauT family transport system substrate-binding protein